MRKGHTQLWALAALVVATAAWSVFAWIAGGLPKVERFDTVCGIDCATFTDTVTVFGRAYFAALVAAIGSSVGLVASFINLACANDW